MKEYQDLFSVVSDLESNLFALEDIQNLLTMFNECFWEDGNAVNAEIPATGDDFTKRFPVLYSTLAIIRLRLGEVLVDMHNNVNEGYNTYNQLKKEPPKHN